MLTKLATILTEAGTMLLDKQSVNDSTFTRIGPQVNASIDNDLHNFLIDKIDSMGTGLPIISEEDKKAHINSRPKKYWLIDPLDGTASFVDGFPGFVIQAALMENNQPVLSCVHAPSLAETFLAEKGSGATRNGDLIVTNKNLNNGLVQTDNYPKPKGIAAEIACDLDIQGYLESGSIGLKICRVAEGKAHLFVKDIELYDWDVAAPHLILRESGGILRDGLGKNFSYHGSFMKNGLITASNKELFLRVLKWVKAR